MRQHRTALAGTFIVLAALASAAGAQAPRPPGGIVPFEDQERKGPPRSDAYRLVGQVLRIDQAEGAIELQTDEGRRTVKASPALVRAVRVGDTVSVERPVDDPASAAPGEGGRSGRRPR
jgi:hypothetical protein